MMLEGSECGVRGGFRSKKEGSVYGSESLSPYNYSTVYCDIGHYIPIPPYPALDAEEI